MEFAPHYSWGLLSEEEIEQRTIRALRNHVVYLKENSPYYKEALAFVRGEDVTSLKAYAKVIPITEKESLSSATESFYAVPDSEVVETVITSGSTGSPLIVPLTTSDLDRLAYNEALSFYNAGVRENDRAQILVSLDRLFIAGMAYYRGLTTLGVNTSRIGVLAPAMQQQYFSLLKPTLLVGVPSYLLKFGRALVTAGVDPRTSGVTRLFCIGEPIRTEKFDLTPVAEELELLFGAEVFSTYASTEMASTFCDCTERTGGHLHPEILYAEIVDLDGTPLPVGEVGELVVTPLGIEGLPLARYRTGDMTNFIPGTCACGRNSRRIGPIISRASQLIKMKGTTIYPATITNTLDQLPYVEDYLIELQAHGESDEVYIHAVMPAARVGDAMSHLQACTRVHIPILVSNSCTINGLRGESRKKIRVLDHRQKGL